MNNNRFELLTAPETDHIWNTFKKRIQAVPLHQSTGATPPVVFLFDTDYAIYSLAGVMSSRNVDRWEGFEKAVDEILKSLLSENQFIYALDWYHSSFRLYPHRKHPEELFEEVFYDQPVGDNLSQRSYRAYYLSFIPDGDFHFFISEDFTWGLLGHPLEQKMWVFGKELIQAFDKHKEFDYVTWKLYSSN